MGLKVERYDGTAADWDAFAAAQPGATHAHRFAWKGVVERVYGHDCPFLCARDAEGALAAVLPLVDVRSPLMGRSFVSMPYLSNGGPLGSADAVRAVVAHAAALAAEARAELLELRVAEPLDLDMEQADEKVTCILPLGGCPDAVFARFPSKLRSQVRRSEKAGATVRFGDGEAEPFFRVFARTMRDLGTPTHPRAFFNAVRRAMGEDGWFGCVYLDGRPAAAGCGIRHGGTVELVWAGSLREASAAAPNMMLYWSFIRRAAQEGAAVFDFGRCTPGGGTHRFKQQWGTTDVPLPWLRARRRPAAAPAREGTAFTLASRMWRHLPLPVATLLGPGIRGGIHL
jgi:FemAB-related protein (PEP-CTERM system-associated)